MAKRIQQQICNANKWAATSVNLHKSRFQSKSGGVIFAVHQAVGFPDDWSAYHERVDEIGPGDFEPCGKVLRITHTYKHANGDKTEVYECGHSRYIPRIEHRATRNDLLWDHLLPFQKDAVGLLESSDINGMLDYEMGLGKTVIAASVVRENYTECGNTLIIGQPMDKYRLQGEFVEWMDAPSRIKDDPLKVLYHTPIVWEGKAPLGGFKTAITTWSALSQPKFQQIVRMWQPRTVIVDECHLYKDMRSQRTKQLLDLFKNNPSIKHKIFMSGTPIMNKIVDFFPVLNQLLPREFPDRGTLYAKCHYDPESKRVLGLDRRYLPWYKSVTEDIIFRMTKAEANIPLPPFERKVRWITLEDCNQPELGAFIKQYNAICDQLELLCDDKANARMHAGSIIGLMQIIRHWTGLIKLPAIIRLAADFMEIYQEKCTIGVHHKLVRQTLVNALQQYGVVSMSDEDAEEKDRIEQVFKTDPNIKFLIASIKGAGQGRNLQFCRNAMVMERWWNFAIEDQFDKRFHRIVKNDDGTVKSDFTEADKVTVEYVCLKDSFDEFTDSMVELKQDICASEEDEIDEMNMFKLARLVAKNRLRFVGI